MRENRVRRRSASAHPGHGRTRHEGGADGDILERLRTISLREKMAKQHQVKKGGILPKNLMYPFFMNLQQTSRGAGSYLASQYQLNYRPMPLGVRKQVWEEGLNYREQRKKAGFNHFRLEWRR